MKGPNILKLIANRKRALLETYTSFVDLNYQIVDVFTKPPREPKVEYIYNKLGVG